MENRVSESDSTAEKSLPCSERTSRRQIVRPRFDSSISLRKPYAPHVIWGGRLVNEFNNVGFQTDDGFLLAFLRTRKFNVKKAFDALVNYHLIRSPNPEMLLPRGKGPRDYLHVIRKGIVIVPSTRNPDDGSIIIIVSLRNFKFENEDVSHVINIIYYLSRLVIRSASFQTLGVRIVIDIEGMTMAFFTTLLRRFYNLKVSSLISSRRLIRRASRQSSSF